MLNKPETRASYYERIDRVLEYIHEHLDDELDVEKLAEVACFSPYHWHRIYRSLAGETAAQTVRRLRLHRAAGDLIRNTQNIFEIAAKAGFGSIEAFTRTFRATYDVPPAQFRSRNRMPPKPRHDKRKTSEMPDVNIETLPSMRLAAIHHVGPYIEIGRAFERLGIWASKNLSLTSETKVLAIYHDDPMVTDPDKLRSHAALTISSKVEGSDEISVLDLEGGRHAVHLHKGPYPELQNSYNWLFGTWLPESNEEVENRPCFEIYLNDPITTRPADLLTEICIPLKG